PSIVTSATARDLEAALGVSRETKKPGPDAARQPGRHPDDLVARRIVLKRDRWDALLRLTTALEVERGIVATPAEVAAIVLEDGRSPRLLAHARRYRGRVSALFGSNFPGRDGQVAKGERFGPCRERRLDAERGAHSSLRFS